MDAGRCFYRATDFEFTRFYMPQIKTSNSTSFIMSCRTRPQVPSLSKGLRLCGNDGAKLRIFFGLTKKMCAPPKSFGGAHIYRLMLNLCCLRILFAPTIPVYFFNVADCLLA